MSRESILKDRAKMLFETRSFFKERNVLEIDCGALVPSAPIDANIDCIQTDQNQFFLHTSPEYALKRFLSEGIGDCYFLGHVYRKQEIGSLHNPEFTMVEWYRKHISFKGMIEETCELITLFLGPLPYELLSYREAFRKYVGIDPSQISERELQRLTHSHWDKLTCLHYLLTHKIEPFLGRQNFTVLTHFPPSEAALAVLTEQEGEKVAERFEIYHEGVELANGYHECSDANELTLRFETINQQRLLENKEPYSLDQRFLSSLKTLPDCCGVALGFDRLLMLRHKLRSIQPVIPYAWDEIFVR